jgi:hypothetical protein
LEARDTPERDDSLGLPSVFQHGMDGATIGNGILDDVIACGLGLKRGGMKSGTGAVRGTNNGKGKARQGKEKGREQKRLL